MRNNNKRRSAFSDYEKQDAISVGKDNPYQPDNRHDDLFAGRYFLAYQSEPSFYDDADLLPVEGKALERKRMIKTKEQVTTDRHKNQIKQVDKQLNRLYPQCAENKSDIEKQEIKLHRLQEQKAHVYPGMEPDSGLNEEIAREEQQLTQLKLQELELLEQRQALVAEKQAHFDSCIASRSDLAAELIGLNVLHASRSDKKDLGALAGSINREDSTIRENLRSELTSYFGDDYDPRYEQAALKSIQATIAECDPKLAEETKLESEAPTKARELAPSNKQLRPCIASNPPHRALNSLQKQEAEQNKPVSPNNTAPKMKNSSSSPK